MHNELAMLMLTAKGNTCETELSITPPLLLHLLNFQLNTAIKPSLFSPILFSATMNVSHYAWL